METIHQHEIKRRKRLWKIFRLRNVANPQPDKVKVERKPDFAEFQRKAYGGNFFAGPLALFHPNLFK